MDKGYTVAATAEILLLEEKTIRRWQERYHHRRNITSFIFHDT
ncbi:MAG: hypothetical protein GY730_11290 [bacterium]|nr:hypothetical protein [bacterium]